MRILIVDDSVTMQRFLQGMLSPVSRETVTAEDGRQALDALAAHWPIDVALVDWDMPVMNGLEFVKAVRAAPKYCGLKIMMVTANNSLEGVDAAIHSGADDYLMKPLTREMIVDKLRILGLVE
jgi:two-component system chemotaxis response regulator CheY